MDYIWTFYINKKSQASINKKLTILNCGPDGTRILLTITSTIAQTSLYYLLINVYMQNTKAIEIIIQYKMLHHMLHQLKLIIHLHKSFLNMATINVEIKSRPNKDGRHGIYIRITENRQHKRFKTGVNVLKKNFRGNKYGKWVKEAELMHAVYNAKIKEAYHEIESKLSENNGFLKEMQLNPSFTDYAKSEIKLYTDLGKHQSAEKLQYSLNKLHDYLKKDNIKFKEINRGFLKEYEKHLKKELNNHTNTIEANFRRFRTTFNNAIKDRIINSNDNPFNHYELETIATNKEKLTENEINKIDKLDLTEHSPEWHTRNYFLFSYYCAGIRFGDLARLKWDNITNGRLIYTMNKTRAHRSLKLVPKALEILDYYNENKKDDDYIFPLLNPEIKPKDKDYIIKIKKNISSKNAITNKHLKSIQEKADIKTNISFHISRHSFADIARKSGADLFTISKLLKHSDLRMTQRYLAELDLDAEDAVMDKLFGD